jgi:hypothetical protein
MLDKHFLTPQPHLEKRHYYIDFLHKSHSEIAEISQLSVIYIQSCTPGIPLSVSLY